MEFDLPKDTSAVIKVIGVGGGGSNAVNHMFNQGIVGVDFIVCNTDRQSLDISPVPIKIQLGTASTQGRGAGSIPQVGMEAANENIEDIRDLLSHDTNMVFITAGLGGGTGTGAAPVIAQIAKDLGILTVGIVTVPFQFEGKKRRRQAEEGLEKMRQNVDTLLVINNQKLFEIDNDLPLSQSFAKADNVLTVAAKGIAELISLTGYINVDFNDVKTVMTNSGQAIMGSSSVSGDNRASEAVKYALNSPLLNDNDINGAKYVLLNITSGDKELTMSEIQTITDHIEHAAGPETEVIFGHAKDDQLGDNINLTLIATGFNTNPFTDLERPPATIMVPLEESDKKEITVPLNEPVDISSDEQMTEFTISEVNDEKDVNFEFPITDVVSDDELQEKVTLTFGDIQSDLDFGVEQSNDELIDNKVDDSDVSDLENTASSDDMIRFELKDSKPMTPEAYRSPKQTSEENKKRIQSRFDKIKEFTARLKRAEGIQEFENEPAYVRRNIKLDDSKASEENNVGQFELGEDEDGKPKLGRNSFLHDNVD
jgi:cell division protein FtsZ